VSIKTEAMIPAEAARNILSASLIRFGTAPCAEWLGGLLRSITLAGIYRRYFFMMSLNKFAVADKPVSPNAGFVQSGLRLGSNEKVFNLNLVRPG